MSRKIISISMGLLSLIPMLSAAAEELFNGRDLSGWDAVLEKPDVAKESVWSVRDGVLVCRGEPMGYLYTTRAFTDVRLIVEWRWAPGTTPGNSGILLRINGEPRPLPRCIEVQLKSGQAGDVYGFHGMRVAGPEERMVRRPDHPLGGDLTGVRKIVAAERAPGEWNRAEIELNGERLRVTINGQLVNEAWGCERMAGPIGLQSEGGEIHFRTVRIEPLPKQ